MTNALTIIRSLVIYSLCLPLAIFLGYLLAMPMDTVSFTIVVCTLFLPLLPLLLKHHHILLYACWNTTVVLFFLPGRPYLGVVMIAVSLLLSVLQHVLNRNIKFLNVPSITRPLIFLLIVLLVTAKLTGGFGARFMGSESYGGKRYYMLLAAIMGYFAISCFRVPPGKAGLYVTLFILGALTCAVGNLAPYVGSSFYFIFAFFPVESLGFAQGEASDLVTRLGGVTQGAVAVISFIMARHGLRGLLDVGERWSLSPIRFQGGFGFNNPWRLFICALMFWVALHGGYRSVVIMLVITFVVLFYYEGLYRTQLLPVLVLLGILGVAIALPMVNRMPIMVQRSLSFLPIEIDPVARYGAESTTEWRLEMWRQLWPQVPKYLLLGKGYSINPSELEMVNDDARRTGSDTAQGAILAGDYHNGPLSVIIPLGIFGAFGFLWLLFAGFRLLLNNYRYGDPELLQINTFLLAYFAARVIFFFSIFGALTNELMVLAGILGMSVSINGGMRQPALEPVEKPEFDQFRLARAAR